MANVRREQYIVVDEFWRFRVSDDGATISMDAFADEQGEYSHLATSIPTAEFIAALWDLGARMPLPPRGDS